MAFINYTTVTQLTGIENKAITRKIAAGGVAVHYQKASDTDTADTQVLSNNGLSIDLMPLLKGTVVPGSLRFKFGSYTYIDRVGVLYHSVDPATGSGMVAGTVNYATGSVNITSWSSGSPAFTLEAGLINPGTPGVGVAIGRTLTSPLKSQSFTISATALDGTAITATAAADGTLTAAHVEGYVDVQTGIYHIIFGTRVGEVWTTKLVDPSTLRYNAVAYSYLPLDAELLGLDPVRLPQDGRVPIFRAGGFAVIGHTATVAPTTVSNAQTINCGRVRLSRVRVLDNNSNVINTGYTANLEAGTVTFTDVTGYVQPVTVEHRIEDMAQVSDVQISGQLTFTRAVTHAYPTGSIVSSALIAGDLKAHVGSMFDQATWNGTYTDVLVGSPATGTFNDVLAPIEVTNVGASTERWVVRFTNTTAFDVLGEHVGLIATGNISTDCAPINPATSQPYFTIPAAGWGGGWAVGNILRFNTTGALFPVWVVRTIQQGPETVINDSFSLIIRGDVDRP